MGKFDVSESTLREIRAVSERNEEESNRIPVAPQVLNNPVYANQVRRVVILNEQDYSPEAALILGNNLIKAARMTLCKHLTFTSTPPFKGGSYCTCTVCGHHWHHRDPNY